MKKISVNGVAYQRALEFAFLACSGAEERSKLAQVVFLGPRVICSDGRSWFVGLFPDKQEIELPVVAARESVAELLLGLEYARRIAGRHHAGFYVEQDGLSVVIHYAERSIKHKLAEVKCGHVPGDWKPPVADAAGAVAELPEFDTDGPMHMVSKYWRKHGGMVKWRGTGVDQPFRGDIRIGKEIVAYAYGLPGNHHAAELPADEPLFNGMGPPKGQSILDLSLDVVKAPPPPKTIKIGDKEWNITNLGHPKELLKLGPCDHRDTREPCPQCTEIAVEAAKADLAKKVVSIKPKARKPKKGDDQPPAPRGA